MIQLTAGGPRIVKDDRWVAQQREFAQRHCVVLEGFLDEGILRRVPRLLEAGEFQTFEHATKKGRVIARELAMKGAALMLQVFFLLLNQPRLFSVVAELTGSEKPIGRFQGRCYKRLPGGEHFDSWHTDDVLNRRYGLVINLSPKPFRGGFQIRNRKTKEVTTLMETRFGDARLFRIHRSLQHRALPVEGKTPKCVYAGWFLGGDADYREKVRETIHPLED